MIVKNDNSLIGDFIGTIPAMIELSKQELQLGVICADSVAELLEMIPKKYGIKRVFADSWDREFNLHGAFALADGEKKLHMIQANYHFVGLPVPENIPRPELEVNGHPTPSYDYCLSPFTRSLPENQKWQRHKWQELIDRMPGKEFVLLGGPGDDPSFIAGNNLTIHFNRPIELASRYMKYCRHGLISVVTGTSHLAYALNVKNYLFFNQGLWGKNPEAVLMEKYIPDITVDEVINILKNV
jgi:ADP-heptose:LPS heptosyltransferase